MTATPVAPTATSWPTPTPLASVLDLAGETTLAEAQTRAGFSILLPHYPEGIGPPDRVFFQDLGGPVVVLAWLDPDRPERVRLSLHFLASQSFAVHKFEPRNVQPTTVRERPAVWAEGPYLLMARSGDIQAWQMVVTGRVLIWEEGEVTYRVETDLALEEVQKIAESLR